MTAEAHPEHVPDLDWTTRAAPFLVPVPAASYESLIGKRVALSDPASKCWRYDIVVVSNPYFRPGHESAHVNILDHHDFCRANRTREKVVTATAPVSLLWVERLYGDWSSIPDGLRTEPVALPPLQPHLDEDSVRVDASRPPIRRTRQGNKVDSITIGSRVLLNTPAGFIAGYRVISDVHLRKHPGPNLFGDLDRMNDPIYLQCYSICDEDDYFSWAATGLTPSSVRYVQCGQLFFE